VADNTPTENGQPREAKVARTYPRPPGAEAMESRLRSESQDVHGHAVVEPFAPRRRLELAWRMTAWIAGLFLLLVGVTMIFDDGRIRRDDPLKSARLKAYHDQLRLDPANEKLKDEIRQLDLKLRARYFGHLSRKESGVYLLLGGATLFVAAMVQIGKLNRRLPIPGPKADASAFAIQTAKMSRWVVTASGAAIGLFLLVSSFSLTTALPRRTAQIEKLLGTGAHGTAVSDSASAEELNHNWAQFRGPNGAGIALFATTPTTWDVKTGAGVAWKVPAPAGCYNSPIIWHDRVFFSGASESERTVFCLDATTGQTLWRESVAGIAGSPKPKSDAPASSNYANSTMATDGRRVYAFFGNGDLAAFTLDGKPAWSKVLGPLKNAYGHAASLTIWHEKLILQLDQGEPEQAKSKLYAFDSRTGQILWQRPRKVGSSWATPIVIEAAGKPQIITLAVPWVIAYSVADGTELWRVEGLNGEITPSPVFTGGLVIVASPSEKLLAIRPDGSGDVTKTHIAWTTEENVPDITSPVCLGEMVFTLTTPGVLSCLNATDGKKQWEHDFEMEFHCSPSIAANRLYLFSMKGTAITVEAARQFKEMFRTEMDDVFDASPAFGENRIFLRGATNIWCLGSTAQKLAKKE
jgi:outer membrane protein assembly factor BamB